jgi:hypothetical protein
VTIVASPHIVGPVRSGRTVRLVSEDLAVAVTRVYSFDTEADAVLLSLWVESLAADLTVNISTFTDTEGARELLLTTFSVSAPTSQLIIRKVVTVMSKIKITVTTTGAANFEIYARGVSGSETSVKILGAISATATATSSTTTAAILIPSALTDRTGLIVKNNGIGPILYLGFSAAEAVPTTGYPLASGESLGMDIAAGVDIWAQAASGTVDVRILQAGN